MQSTIHSLAQEVASNLPGHWQVGEKYGSPVLIDQVNGISFLFSPKRDEQSIIVTHLVPRATVAGELSPTAPEILVYKIGSSEKAEFPRMKVSDKKAGAQIAKDIQRRILQQAIDTQLLANMSLAAMKKHYQNREDAFSGMLESFGPRSKRNAEHVSLVSSGGHVGGYAYARIHSETSIEFSITSLGIEKAKKLAEFIKTLLD
jgi:hypothetical protein